MRALRTLLIIAVAFMVIVPLISSSARADDNQRKTSFQIQGNDIINLNSLSSGPIQQNEYSVIFAQDTFLVMFKDSAQSTSYNLEFNVQMLNLTANVDGRPYTLIDFTKAAFYLVSSPETSDGVVNFSLIAISKYAAMRITIVAVNQTESVQTQAGTVVLSPNEVKLTFEIIPLIDDVMPNSTLTLNMHVNTTSPISSADGGLESQLTFADDGYAGYFSWSNTAYVDGRNAGVVSSLSAGILSLTYPFGHIVVQDPYLGISPSTLMELPVSAASLLPNAGLFAITAALATAAVLAAIFYKKRRA